MSVDRSLKVKGSLVRHRNVLSRTERVMQLKQEERFAEDDPVLGLPKIVHRKSHAGRKSKEEKAAAAGAVAATAPAAPAAEKPTKTAKAAKPAKPA